MNWRARRAKKLDEAKAIVKKAEDENRDLTADEVKRIEALKAEAAQIKADGERDDTIRAGLDAEDTEVPGQPAGRKSPPPRVDSVREAFLDDPMRGYKTPRALHMDVIRASTGGAEDPRLRSLRAPKEAAAGGDEHSGQSNPYGQWLVPIGMAPGLLKLDPPEDPIRGTRPVPMRTPTLKFNARTDKNHSSSVSAGLRVYRRVETQAVTASRMETEQVTLEAHALMGASFATEEILRDSPESFASMIADGFRDEFGSKRVQEFLNGTGVGMPLGIRKSPALLTIDAETGQAADTVVYQNVLKMYSRCWGKNRATWIANHGLLPTLAQMNLSIGTGGVPVWMPSAREGEPNTLFGRPVIFTEYASAPGDLGDLMLVNWFEVLEGNYEPIEGASSIHVRFVEHESCFKYWLRNGGVPWWRSVLTPKNGPTMSPYVILAAR